MQLFLFVFFLALFCPKSPAANGGLKPTTVAPAEVDSTASRGTADVASPVVTGQNLKKSQTKKTKRGEIKNFGETRNLIEVWGG